jgi:hypothetical protein
MLNAYCQKILIVCLGLLIIGAGCSIRPTSDKVQPSLPVAGTLVFAYDTKDTYHYHVDPNVHVDTTINSTYAQLAAGSQAAYVCTGGAEDQSKKPYGPIVATCLQGHGAKMVVPFQKNYVINSPATGGFFEQAHMASGFPRQFFRNDTIWSTKYFVVPFNGLEVPTYDPDTAKKLLPVWKEAFQKINNLSDQYFSDHIRVIGAQTGTAMDVTSKPSEKNTNLFIVHYELRIDWAQIETQDDFAYRSDSNPEDIVASLVAHNGKSNGGISAWDGGISRLSPVEYLVSQDIITRNIRAVSPYLNFNIDGISIDLDPRGSIQAGLDGMLDENNNQCITSQIDLSTGKVQPITNTACWIS